MNPTPGRYFLRLICLAVLLMGGCAAPAPSAKRTPTILVTLRVTGNGEATPQQLAKVQEMIAPGIAQAGLQFTDSWKEADYIMTAIFTPDPANPNGGYLGVISINRSRPSHDYDQGDRSLEMEAQKRIQELDRWASNRSPKD